MGSMKRCVCVTQTFQLALSSFLEAALGSPLQMAPPRLFCPSRVAWLA